MSVRAFLLKLLQTPEPKPAPGITFDELGVTIRDSEEVHFPWSAILRVVGYKYDLVTVDEIRIDLYLDEGTFFNLSEENRGFAEFMAELENRFPSCVGWHARIAHPAFNRNHTVLFDAPNQPLHPDALTRAGERRR